MRRGTKAAAPPEYSRTDLLLIQSLTWHKNHPFGWFLFWLSVCQSEPIGFDHKHLKRVSAAAAFAAAVLTCASKQMRRGTKAAAPPEYSRTDLLLIQSFTWHKTIHPDGFFFVIRMSERTHRVRPQAFCHHQMAAMHCIAAFGKAKRKCAVARRRPRRAVFENRMPMRYNAIKMSAQQTVRRFVSRQRLL